MFEGSWWRRTCSMISPRSAEEKDRHSLDVSLQADVVGIFGLMSGLSLVVLYRIVLCFVLVSFRDQERD